MTCTRTARSMAAFALDTALAIVMTACGGGGSTNATTNVQGDSGPPTVVPSASPSVDPGPQLFPPTGGIFAGDTYTSVMTDPSITMTLPGTWSMFGQSANFVAPEVGSGGYTMTEFYVFKFDGRVVDPKDNETIVHTQDLIGWLRTNPHIRFLTRPKPATVGGARGRVFDIEAVNAPDCAYFHDGTRCWNLLPMIEGNPYSPTAVGNAGMLVIGPGLDPSIQAPDRFWLLNVHGQDMGIVWQDDAPTFKDSVKNFETILKSVEWS